MPLITFEKPAIPVALALIACLLPTQPINADSPLERFEIQASDVPWWRGVHRDGVAHESADPPLNWSAETNIAWRSPIPGRGHGSPTVLGDRVYVATAEASSQRQWVICFDRTGGKEVWREVVHQGGFSNSSKRKMNQKASLASSTIATDGQRLYINFLNDNAVRLTAMDLDGGQVWQREVSDYVVHQGYGASPTIHGDLVIAAADNKSGGAVVAFDRKTGDVVWRHERPAKPNYSSPIILRVDGRDQLILTGCDLVTSLDPTAGDVLWTTEGATKECVTSPVTDGRRVFSSGGYPRNHIAAYRHVASDAGNKDNVVVEWENNMRAYVPSLLYYDRHLFAVLDEGIAVCLRSEDGKVRWKKRLGGTYSSSPVLVGGQIFATSEDGVTHVFEANPDGFEALAENRLGASVFATPAFSGDTVFYRAAERHDGQRQEFLYAIRDE